MAGQQPRRLLIAAPHPQILHISGLLVGVENQPMAERRRAAARSRHNQGLRRSGSFLTLRPLAFMGLQEALPEPD